MASIANDPNGRKRILFIAADGRRHTVRLGKASVKQAEAFKVKVEQLVAATVVGHPPDDETSRWVAGLDDVMHGRLSTVGLLKARNRAAATLKTFLVDFFASLSVKSGTATAYGHTQKYLIEFFGEGRQLRAIEPADADKWRQHLKGSGLSDSTVGRRVGVARQMFKRAVKWKLIVENPFADVKGGSQTNKARMFFVSREAAQKVLDACPNVQWRLLFALSRYGGLRCPSEHLALTWTDVDWEQGRIRISSPKTEHHEGGDCRVIPLFPELRQYLMEAFEQAEPGTKYVITRYRETNANLRTQLCRIIRRAGLTPWPKLFHNLRSSRQTELAERYPIHVVCAWIGNSRAVAQNHYLQLTDAHFEQAASIGMAPQAAHKAAQQPAERPRTGSQVAPGQTQNPPVLPGDSASYDSMRSDLVGAAGFEPAKA